MPACFLNSGAIPACFLNSGHPWQAAAATLPLGFECAFAQACGLEDGQAERRGSDTGSAGGGLDLLAVLDERVVHSAAAERERAARLRVSEWVRQLPALAEEGDEDAPARATPPTPGELASDTASLSSDSPSSFAQLHLPVPAPAQGRQRQRAEPRAFAGRLLPSRASWRLPAAASQCAAARQ